MRALPLSLIALAALAACDSGAGGADETAATADTTAEAPLPVPQADATETPDSTEIPVAIRGRWGLVPADCEPGRADAKGLLTISADKLEFYESVGTLDEVDESTASRLAASFDFTGEGMTWERDVTLELAEGGSVLIRREQGDGADTNPLRYEQC